MLHSVSSNPHRWTWCTDFTHWPCRVKRNAYTSNNFVWHSFRS